MRRELLRLESVSLGDHGQRSLEDFSLVLNAGEILGVFSTHATVKSDLVRLIAGQIGADAGRIYLSGEPSPFEESNLHRWRKVGVIHSARTLIDVLSVSENIFVIRKGVKAGVIDHPLLDVQARQLIDEFGMSIAPETLVRNLSDVDRCCLEVLKAIALGAQIVVFKDLSSFLPDSSIEQLLEFAARLKARGIGLLLVESSVGTLARYAERVVVIKNGRNFWTFAGGTFSDEALKTCFARKRDTAPSEDRWSVAEEESTRRKVLVFDRVSSGVLDDLSFSLVQGEELCILDQAGNGIEEVRALLSGEHRPSRGRILANGVELTARNAWQALDQKIAFIAENPAESMVFRDLSAIENLCLPSSRKAAGFWLNPTYVSSCLKEYGPYFGPDVLNKYPDELSAQDLHRLVYCRWHLYKPDVVVCIKPYSSVDKTLEEISAIFIDLLLRKGIAVLILTSSASEAESARRKISINQKNAPLHQKNDL
jgi:ribose transport system ATP-binding protein